MTENLCQCLGYSKQAYYKSLRVSRHEEEYERYLVSIIKDIRFEMPCLGVNKLWRLLNTNGLWVGRDWLYDLLHRHRMMIKMKKYRAKTTDSRAWQHQYDNLVKGLRINRANQVWVSDITYIETKKGFVYLSLVTDAYSRRIMGWQVHDDLNSQGVVNALQEALKTAGKDLHEGLIHHSDRGGQYCSALYTGILKQKHIKISTTQDGSPYDNAIAERVNGILKREWINHMNIDDMLDAREKVKKVIETYNYKRPHMAIAFQTPIQAYKEKLKRFQFVMF